MTPDGEPLAPFKGTKANLIAKIRDTIFDPEADYTQTVDPKHWINTQHTWPVAAHLEKKTIIVYTKGNRSRRSTRIFDYDSDTNKVTILLKVGAYITPPVKVVPIIHNGTDHFEALRVTRVSLTEIFRAMVTFGFKDGAVITFGILVGGGKGGVASDAVEESAVDTAGEGVEGAGVIVGEDVMEVVGDAVCGTREETQKGSRGEGKEGVEAAAVEDGVAPNEHEGWLTPDVGREKSDGGGSPRRQTHLALSFSSPAKEHLTNSMHRNQASSFRGERLDSSGKLLTTYSTNEVIEAQVPVAKVRELIDVQLTALGELQSVSWRASEERTGSKPGRAIIFNTIMQDVFPPYFRPKHRNSSINKITRDGRGRKTSLGLVAQFHAVCPNDGCTTNTVGGWNRAQCIVVGQNLLAEVGSVMRLTGKCNHEEMPHGRLSGGARASAIKKVCSPCTMSLCTLLLLHSRHCCNATNADFLWEAPLGRSTRRQEPSRHDPGKVCNKKHARSSVIGEPSVRAHTGTETRPPA